MTVKGNIENVKDDLSSTELMIASYILNHQSEVVNMSVHTLADKSETSAATVSRFARHISFKNYNELKMQLSADLTANNTDTKLYEEIHQDEDLYAIKEKLLYNAQQSIKETVDLVKPETINDLVSTLKQSKQILLFGVGASYLVALNISQKWSRLGHFCVANDDLNQILPLIVNGDKKDSVLWLISNTGESPEVILAAKNARKNGMKVVTLTKLGTNSLSKLADISIQTSQPMESSIRIAATQSLHAQYMLVDIVYYAYVSKFYGLSEERINDSRAAVNDYKKSMRDGF
jgi:DNA-binding MurR/RpiR family transcriptional regulator